MKFSIVLLNISIILNFIRTMALLFNINRNFSNRKIYLIN